MADLSALLFNLYPVLWLSEQNLRPGSEFNRSQAFSFGNLLYRQGRKRKSSEPDSGTDGPKVEQVSGLNLPARIIVFGLIVLTGTGCCLTAYDVLETDQPGITGSFLFQGLYYTKYQWPTFALG
ncbi:MAG: hypothetical protein PHI24_03250 [Desulfitobacteriaceae bacterium]|nr:hypothetical protein [Desulfitobacteriaceae bacterium]